MSKEPIELIGGAVLLRPALGSGEYTEWDTIEKVTRIPEHRRLEVAAACLAMEPDELAYIITKVKTLLPTEAKP